MKKLYRIQDNERPMYVLAASWADALTKWMTLMSSENPDLPVEEIEGPQGIEFIADEDEILL